MDLRDVRKLTTKLDVIASSLERKRPDLALALDLVSDRIERKAGYPKGIVDLHKEYLNAGGKSSVSHFLDEDIPLYLKHLGKDGSDIWEWDKTVGPASKKKGH